MFYWFVVVFGFIGICLNVSFGVPKPDKTIPSGESVLRATNFFMKQIEGDTNTLTGAASFQRIIVEEDQQLMVSGEELTAVLYTCWFQERI